MLVEAIALPSWVIIAAPRLRGKGEGIIKRWLPNCELIHLLGVLTKLGGWHLFHGTNLVIIACTAAPAGWLCPRIPLSAYSTCRYSIMHGNYL